jgi:hypothetical protein
MALRNRVGPDAEIVSNPGRGLFMGNRGILHDRQGRLVRPFASKAWICCVLSFKNRLPPDPLVKHGTYTRLFFLDEAVALSAGHRPCAECRRDDYNRFRAAWDAAGLSADKRAPAIDGCLHDARIEPLSRKKRVIVTEIASLPDGAFVAADAGACLVRGGSLFPFSPGGYGTALPRPSKGTVTVLTPAPILAVLHEGYVPVVHPSTH